MSKKKIFSLAVIAIMIAILSFSTLAWFTDNDSATNDFNIGGADENDPDQIFSVDVKENVDGEEEPVDGMDFDDILPGDHFTKEAYITNTGSYDQYIRVTMTISDWELIKDIVTINMDNDFYRNWYIVSLGVSVNMLTGELTATWPAQVNADGELVVTMFLNKKLAPGDTVQIMDYVSISTRATQEDFAAEGFEDGFQITIEAEAVQTENILPNLFQNERSEAPEEWEKAQMTFDYLESEAE